jgi:hypothetical protein
MQQPSLSIGQLVLEASLYAHLLLLLLPEKLQALLLAV